MLETLKNDENVRKKLGVQEEWVKDLVGIPVINSEIGRDPAKLVCEKYKVKVFIILVLILMELINGFIPRA